jgi:hypothetical protein
MLNIFEEYYSILLCQDDEGGLPCGEDGQLHLVECKSEAGG